MKHSTPPPLAQLLTRAQVERLTGLSTSSLYRAMRRGDFPEPLRISERSVRWRADEIDSWITKRPRATGVAGVAACRLDFDHHRALTRR